MTMDVEAGADEVRRRGRGRPRAFDREAAVERAMRLFWERGYDGTSYTALIAAMGVSASSLQNAFGSKEALFREALRYYDHGPGGWFGEALAAPGTARQAIERLLSEATVRLTDPDVPAGCMISLAALQAAPETAPLRAFATEVRQASQRLLADRIRRGIAGGDVPSDTDADALADYFATVFRGLAVRAHDGASPAELAKVGRYAMSAWPAD